MVLKTGAAEHEPSPGAWRLRRALRKEVKGGGAGRRVAQDSGPKTKGLLAQNLIFLWMVPPDAVRQQRKVSLFGLSALSLRQNDSAVIFKLVYSEVRQSVFAGRKRCQACVLDSYQCVQLTFLNGSRFSRSREASEARLPRHVCSSYSSRQALRHSTRDTIVA